MGVKLTTTTGEVVLNPGRDYVYNGEDEILFLAEDDDTYEALAIVSGKVELSALLPLRLQAQVLATHPLTPRGRL